MIILITNAALENWTGSELYARDIARGLRGRGHQPFLFSFFLGPLAEEMRREGFVVVDDLSALPTPPDLIHGQHLAETMAAIAFFAEVPAVFFCHGIEPWEEIPPHHPRIRRYVAVSDHVAEHMILRAGIREQAIDVVANFVDTGRFAARGSLPPQPRRALVFSNYVGESAYLSAVREACGRLGIAVDVIGAGVGRTVENPEELLGSYDVVFAIGRSALEAMAVGAAVILGNTEGIGGLVTSADFGFLRQGRIGRAALTLPATADLIERELRRYSAADAAAVRDHVRAEASLEVALERIVPIYERGIAEFPGPLSAEEERAAMHRHHRRYARAVRQRLLEPSRAAESRIAAALDRAKNARLREAACARRAKTVESSLAWRLAIAAGRLPGVLWLYRALHKTTPAPQPRGGPAPEPPAPGTSGATNARSSRRPEKPTRTG